MGTTDDSAPTTILSDEYEPTSEEPVSVRVARSVAVAADREPTELTPLGEVVDVDALETLCRPDGSGTAVEISFDYEGYRVRIDDQLRITVREQPQ